MDGVTVLDTPYLIPFKAKAWMGLSDRKAAGGQVDSRNIRKHKNDVFRLTELLDRNRKTAMYVPNAVLDDIRAFIERMALEEVDLKQLGILGKTKEVILEELRSLYG